MGRWPEVGAAMGRPGDEMGAEAGWPDMSETRQTPETDEMARSVSFGSGISFFGWMKSAMAL